MGLSESNIQEDIKTINGFSVVPLILKAICCTTGMGFAAIARVTDERWIACSVLDEVKFGLSSGSELKLETTICHEIRQSGNAVIIDYVKNDNVYQNHHTPAMYGLQSYISVPIKHKDGTFFGTLCAIDAKPALLNTPEIIGMFKAYAHLISFYLTAVERLPQTKVNLLQTRANDELKQYLEAVLERPSVLLSAASINTRDAQFNQIIHTSANRINVLIEQLQAM